MEDKEILYSSYEYLTDMTDEEIVSIAVANEWLEEGQHAEQNQIDMWRDELNSNYWYFVTEDLKDKLKDYQLIIQNKIANNNKVGYLIVDNFDKALHSCCKYSDYQKIYKKGDKLCIYTVNHDYSDVSEIKILTKEGENYYLDESYEKGFYQICDEIWNNDKLSTSPEI